MATSKVAPPQHSSENSCGSAAHRCGDAPDHVDGAHARGQQRLVAVAHRRVGEQHRFCAASSRRTSAGLRVEQVRVPGRGRRGRLNHGTIGAMRAAGLAARPALRDGR
jgi:hypothetical protein